MFQYGVILHMAGQLFGGATFYRVHLYETHVRARNCQRHLGVPLRSHSLARYDGIDRVEATERERHANGP